MSVEPVCRAPSTVLGRKLLDAIGIRHAMPWQRVVIVCDVEQVPQVYVKGLVFNADSREEDRVFSAIAQAVKDVTVDDDGNVTIVGE